MFIITACVYVVGALGFILLGQGQTQEWALGNNANSTSTVANRKHFQDAVDVPEEKEKLELK